MAALTSPRKRGEGVSASLSLWRGSLTPTLAPLAESGRRRARQMRLRPSNAATNEHHAAGT